MAGLSGLAAQRQALQQRVNSSQGAARVAAQRQLSGVRNQIIAGGRPGAGAPTGIQSIGNVNVSNPNAVIGAQQTSNNNALYQSSRINNPNEVNPYGSKITTWDPTTGQPTVTTNLSANQQGLVNQNEAFAGQAFQGANNAIGQARNVTANPFSYNGLPQAPGTGDFQVNGQQAQDMVYQDYQRMGANQRQQSDQAFAQNLSDRGIAFGSPQYDQAMSQYRQDQALADNNARTQAAQVGYGRQDQLFNQGMNVHNTAVQDYATQRNAPMAEADFYSRLGQGGIATPQYNGYQATQVNPVDVGGIGSNYAQIEAAKHMGGGGGHMGGGGGPTPEDLAMIAQLQAQGQQQPKKQSPWAGIATGLAGSFGSAFLGGYGTSLGKGF